MRISEKIKQKRIENSISRNEVAKFMGITRQTIAGWETDVNLPSAKYLVELCLILNTDPNWLLGFEQREQK